MEKEGVLWDRLAGGAVRCRVCQVRCVIPEGKRGICATRRNHEGRLLSIIHGSVSTVCLDPVEKKPLFHFLPGAIVLSAGTRGCNLRCPGCQNWQVSHDAPADDGSNLDALSPGDSVDMAIEAGARGLSWTYNEPVIWIEHVLEAAEKARARGLFTVLVTNGMATPEALEMLAPHLDVYRLDVKAFSKKSFKTISGGFTRWQEQLEVAVLAKEKHGLHVECVTNVTPGVNDSDDELRAIARWIARSLGPLTPWHATRFYPHKDLSHLPPTPVERVERAQRIGEEEGLAYSYVGNLPGHAKEDTRCHACGELLVKRRAFAIAGGALVDGKCGKCGVAIPGKWDAGPIGTAPGKRFRLPIAG